MTENSLVAIPAAWTDYRLPYRLIHTVPHLDLERHRSISITYINITAFTEYVHK